MGNPDVRQLLHRSEDEIWLACLFAFHTQNAFPDQETARLVSPRLSGMFEHFRSYPAFVAVSQLPSAAEFGRGCSAFLENLPLNRLSPEVHHLLALYFADVAAALSPLGVTASEAVTRYLCRSLAHWLRLYAEDAYLRDWVKRIADDRADVQQILGAFLDRRISALAARARTSFGSSVPTAASGIVRVLSPRGRADVWTLAVLPKEEGAALRRAMTLAFESLVQELMDTFLREMDTSQAKGEEAPLRSERVVNAGLRLSEATQEYEEAELLVLERAEQVGWDLRRGKHWKSLSHLYAKLSKLVLRLADRVEHDPDKFAFAARAAQALTFLADAKDNLDERIELTLRALRLCPGHPMAQTMLSFYLASKGLKILRAATGSRDSVNREARALHDRARELDPKDEAVKQLGELLATLGA